VRLLHCFLARHICDLLLAVQITGLTPQMTGGLPPIAAGATGTSVMQLTGGQQQQQPYQPQATGAPVYPGMVPHVTGAAYAGATGPGAGGPAAAAGLTGPQLTGANAAAAGVLPGFPPLTPVDMQRYQATFLSTDTDRDGLVKVGWLQDICWWSETWSSSSVHYLHSYGVCKADKLTAEYQKQACTAVGWRSCCSLLMLPAGH
jgi:hypothetical protein